MRQNCLLQSGQMIGTSSDLPQDLKEQAFAFLRCRRSSSWSGQPALMCRSTISFGFSPLRMGTLEKHRGQTGMTVSSRMAPAVHEWSPCLRWLMQNCFVHPLQRNGRKSS